MLHEEIDYTCVFPGDIITSQKYEKTEDSLLDKGYIEFEVTPHDQYLKDLAKLGFPVFNPDAFTCTVILYNDFVGSQPTYYYHLSIRHSEYPKDSMPVSAATHSALFSYVEREGWIRDLGMEGTKRHHPYDSEKWMYYKNGKLVIFPC